MRPLQHPPLERVSLTSVLHALADPTRLTILRRLAAAEESLPCNCAAKDLSIPKSTLSVHYRVLREAGLIATARQGTAALNSLRREEVDARFPGLLDKVLGLAAIDCPLAQAEAALAAALAGTAPAAVSS